MPNNTVKKIKGFTLIEILIVISIMAVLATVFINVSTINTKKARDAQRKAELKQYQNALELYANKNNGFYPSRITGTGTQASSTLCSDLALTACAQDPSYPKDNTFNYLYQSDGTGTGTAVGTKYVLWDKLEAISPTTYWVYCSNGKSGQITVGIPPVTGICPLP